MKKMLVLAAIVHIAAIAMTEQCQGAVSTFTSRASWELAVGQSPDFLVDFNDYTTRKSFETMPLDVGPFSIVKSSGIVTGLTNEVRTGSFGVDDSPFAQVFLDLGDAPEPTEVTIWFDIPVTSWGADFGLGVDTEGADIVTSNGLTIPVPAFPSTLPPNPSVSSFFGFVTSTAQPISSITFKSRLSLPHQAEGFALDNVVGVLVPEPTSTVLLLGIFVGCAGLARRRLR